MYKIILKTENFITTLDRVSRYWFQSCYYNLSIIPFASTYTQRSFTQLHSLTHPIHTHLGFLVPAIIYISAQWAGIADTTTGNLGNALPEIPVEAMICCIWDVQNDNGKRGRKKQWCEMLRVNLGEQ